MEHTDNTLNAQETTELNSNKHRGCNSVKCNFLIHSRGNNARWIIMSRIFLQFFYCIRFFAFSFSLTQLITTLYNYNFDWKQIMVINFVLDSACDTEKWASIFLSNAIKSLLNIFSKFFSYSIMKNNFIQMSVTIHEISEKKVRWETLLLILVLLIIYYVYTVKKYNAY